MLISIYGVFYWFFITFIEPLWAFTWHLTQRLGIPFWFVEVFVLTLTFYLLLSGFEELAKWLLLEWQEHPEHFYPGRV